MIDAITVKQHLERLGFPSGQGDLDDAVKFALVELGLRRAESAALAEDLQLLGKAALLSINVLGMVTGRDGLAPETCDHLAVNDDGESLVCGDCDAVGVWEGEWFVTAPTQEGGAS